VKSTISTAEDNKGVTPKTWTCFVEVKARPNTDVLGKARGALATAVNVAIKHAEFTQKLAKALDYYELISSP
jgi:hypothetical protein